MKIEYFLEFRKEDLSPVRSFKLKDKLNPKIWDNFKINTEVREDLLKIAHDFYEWIDLDCEITDIVLTGSLSNYNYSKYSDYDLHILIDFTKVDDNIELVKKYVDSAKSIWNRDHDIEIKGYEVEVYVQDIKEPHEASGIFSLLHNKWKVRPVKGDFTPNEEKILSKSKSFMMLVDRLEDEVDEDKYDKFKEKIQNVWERIKKMRKSALESGGEMSLGNLVFKTLRRNGYIGKIMDLKRYSYDSQFNK